MIYVCMYSVTVDWFTMMIFVSAECSEGCSSGCSIQGGGKCDSDCYSSYVFNADTYQCDRVYTIALYSQHCTQCLW